MAQRTKFDQTRTPWLQGGSIVTALPKSPFQERGIDSQEDLEDFEIVPEWDEEQQAFIIPLPDDENETQDHRPLDAAVGD